MLGTPRPLTLAGWATWLAASLLAPVHAQSPVDGGPYQAGAGLTARLRGDPMALPADAARCANCHEPARQPNGPDASLGPRLDARLAQSLARRGGPPSAYDAAALCTLLRTGVDPAGVLLRRVMPVYEVDAAACATLWRALSQRAIAPGESP
jgi:hypothetical protein